MASSTSLLKVSKFQKQIILSSHSPKNQRNFSHFSALASKKSWKIVQTQDESTKILIWCYLTQWNSFIALIRPLLKARAKNVKNFVGFLGNEKTRLFAFEIYWPLAIAFFSGRNFFPIFFLDFYFPFLFGILFPFFLWFFISLFFLDCYFPSILYQFFFNSFSIRFQFYCGHSSWILPSFFLLYRKIKSWHHLKQQSYQ